MLLAFASSSPHAQIVAPVVATSSTISTCFPSMDFALVSSNAFFTFSNLWNPLRRVWLSLKLFLHITLLLIGRLVTSLMPFAISTLWLYPLSNRLFLVSGTGTIMSIPSKNPDACISFAASIPRCLAMVGWVPYLNLYIILLVSVSEWK